MKKTFSILLILCFIFTMPNNVHAGYDEPSHDDVIDISKDSYSFYGEASYSDLYTDYWFTGQERYTVKIKNHGDKDLRVKIYKNNDIFANESETIKPGYTSWFEVGKFKETDKFYIKFEAPSDFSGKVY